GGHPGRGPRQHVPPGLVGAERVGRARRGQPVRVVGGVRVRAEQRDGERGHGEEDQHRRPRPQLGAPAHRALPGSTAAAARSASVFATTWASTPSSTVPCTTATSRATIASTRYGPTPGHVKIVSTTAAPASSEPTVIPIAVN